jgi:hypothetical protein
VLEGVDLHTTAYQVSMYSDAQEDEGVGNVRPVYSAECAAGVGCPSFVGPYRVGGGVGEFTDTEDSRDTDTRDSNALDIISGDVSQAEAMDWNSGAVVVPYVSLTAAEAPGDGEDGQSGTDDNSASTPAPVPGEEEGGQDDATTAESTLPVTGATLGGAFVIAALTLAGAGAALHRAARSRR